MRQELIVTPSPDKMRSRERDIALDYLRSFIIILVIFLHASLAYASFSTFDPITYYKSSAPVVDTVRWPLLDLFVIFFDTFMMSLLFFVSGIFVNSSLARQGSKDFFLARLRRLGLPFAAGALLLAPLAFWPSYLMSTPTSPTSYWIRVFTSDGWPVGPPWFLWILLVFNGLVALINRMAPFTLAKLRQPTVLGVFLISLAAFVPMNIFLPTYYWVTLGPFDMQPARVGLYLAYFLMGMAFGANPQWQKVEWPKRWGLWLVVGTASFVVYMILSGDVPPVSNFVMHTVYSVAFAVSCAGMSLGVLGAFRKFVRMSHPIFDNLSANSYGIYLLHYAITLWLQFALIPVPWPAWAKFCAVFPGAIALSWGLSALVRRIPAVRRIL